MCQVARTSFTAIVLSFGICFCGCAKEGAALDKDSPKQDQVSMKIILPEQSRRWRYPTPAQYVIRSEGQWQKMWRRGHPPRRVAEQPPPPPPMSFEKEMIIAVFQGMCPSGGYRIEIKEINETDEGINVVVQQRRPGPQEGTTAVITNPSHLVSVPRSDKVVRFRIVRVSGH
ncbi:MAG: protease complex subunit PrcB family protein [Planctomycetes bacterium]|nr:protease complex subunit PrcB family protein [Planctomycetota bacterium]